MSLVKELIKDLLPEQEEKIIATYGGGFKPPTKGHFEVVKKSIEENPDIDEFLIYVGSGEGNGITQTESISIWEIYKQYLPTNVKLEPSKGPIGDIIRLGKNNPQDKIYFILGARDGDEGDLEDIKNRTKTIDSKHSNIEVKIITTKNEGISGTNARNASKISLDKFKTFVPTELSDEEIEQVYNIVADKITESVNFVSLEKTLDDMFEDLGIDINFTKHFKERVISRGLTEEDIIELMEKIYDTHGDEVADLDKDENRVFTHIRRLIDIAAVNVGYGEDYLKDLVLKTAYKRNSSREPEFKTNNTSPKLKVNENATYSQNIDIKKEISKLTKHMIDKGMNIQPLPNLKFINGDRSNAQEFLGKTAYYDPNSQTIVLYTEGRHPKDIVRSFSHEMVHHIQNLEGRLGDVSTTNTHEDGNLNDIEAEANLKGTMTFRNWTDSLQEIIKKENSNWVVYSKSGRKLGTHQTKKSAEKQLQAIHINQTQNEDTKDPFGLNQYARELMGEVKSTTNEGRYDTISNKISSLAFKEIKDIHDKGDVKGTFEFSVGPAGELNDIEYGDLEFDVEGHVEITDGIYKVDGGSNAGVDIEGDEVHPFISIKFQVPKNPKWQEVSMDLKDVARHEIEHLTHDGLNLKPNKYTDPQLISRALIKLGLQPDVEYYKLDSEIDAMLQGMYFKAKKSKIPFKKVINDYLNKVGLNDQEKKEVITIWRSRRKALSLPMFESEKSNYMLFVDLDGVLADFDKGYKELTGVTTKHADAQGKEEFWGLFRNNLNDKNIEEEDYWVNLEWMSDGKELWDYVKEHKPYILSAPSTDQTIPREERYKLHNNSSMRGKNTWGQRLDNMKKMYFRPAKLKADYAGPNKILIDDRKDTIDMWNQKGGIGIHHTSTASTIDQLKKLNL